MNLTKSNMLKSLSIFLLVMIFTLTNDIYLRNHYIEFTNELRLVDHFLAGMSIPIILYLLLGDIYKRCVFYVIWCFTWEISQFIDRGYFQYNQFIFDMFGIGISIILYKLKFIVRSDKNII